MTLPVCPSSVLSMIDALFFRSLRIVSGLSGGSGGESGGPLNVPILRGIVLDGLPLGWAFGDLTTRRGLVFVCEGS